MNETTSDSVTYYVHPHPAHRAVYIEDEPNFCIFCMPNIDTPASHFVQDDRGWMMPVCDRHYEESQA